jgi:hypothetical protein
VVCSKLQDDICRRSQDTQAEPGASRRTSAHLSVVTSRPGYRNPGAGSTTATHSNPLRKLCIKNHTGPTLSRFDTSGPNENSRETTPFATDRHRNRQRLHRPGRTHQSRHDRCGLGVKTESRFWQGHKWSSSATADGNRHHVWSCPEGEISPIRAFLVCRKTRSRMQIVTADHWHKCGAGAVPIGLCAPVPQDGKCATVLIYLRACTPGARHDQFSRCPRLGVEAPDSAMHALRP